MQVNSNGLLSFRNPFNTVTPLSFPLTTNDTVIAPFWADIDITDSGQIFFRFTDNSSLLSSVQDRVFSAFGIQYLPSLLFIATWNRVAEFGGSSSEVSMETIISGA